MPVVGLHTWPAVQREGTSTQVGALQTWVTVLQMVVGAAQSALEPHPTLQTGVVVRSQYCPAAQGCPASAQFAALQTSVTGSQ